LWEADVITPRMIEPLVPVSLLCSSSPSIAMIDDIVPALDAPLLNSTNLSREGDASSSYKSVKKLVLVCFRLQYVL
jgi:hypothetical protein